MKLEIISNERGRSCNEREGEDAGVKDSLNSEVTNFLFSDSKDFSELILRFKRNMLNALMIIDFMYLA